MTLAEYLAASKTTRLDFAQRLGVTDSAVSRWASGRRCPSVVAAFAIERESKGAVPASSWKPIVSTPEGVRKATKRAVRRVARSRSQQSSERSR